MNDFISRQALLKVIDMRIRRWEVASNNLARNGDPDLIKYVVKVGELKWFRGLVEAAPPADDDKIKVIVTKVAKVVAEMLTAEGDDDGR